MPYPFSLLSYQGNFIYLQHFSLVGQQVSIVLISQNEWLNLSYNLLKWFHIYFLLICYTLRNFSIIILVSHFTKYLPLLHTLGEGNGNPLQYSCLESSMDREAWWVHAVAKSRTLLHSIHTHTNTHRYIPQLPIFYCYFD